MTAIQSGSKKDMKMLRNNTITRTVSLFTLLIACNGLYAQLGGYSVYKFLWNPPSARISALGGNIIATRDDDPTVALQNPAALNSLSHNRISFNYRFSYADVNDGYLSYAFNYKPWGMNFHAGAQFATYGDFKAADAYGNITGSFKASDNAFIIGASRDIYERLTVGANLKFVSSTLENYGSSGLVADFGASYHVDDKNFVISLVCRNAGSQLTAYNDIKEPVPFEMQLGVSKRLAHLPFRFSVIFTNLQKWNILYDDPNLVDDGSLFGGEAPTERSKSSIYFDNLFRHFIFNGEFYIGKKENLRLRIGYNHMLRKELSVKTFRSLAGFSGGFGIKISKFRIDYGRSIYHLVGGINHLSISTDIDDFRKVKN